VDRAVAVLFCGFVGFCVGAAATFVIGISQITSPACDGPCDQWNGVAAVSVVVGCLVAALFGFAWYRLSEPSSAERALMASQGKLAYRFVPVGREDAQHENSHVVTVTTERLGIGSRIEVELLGYRMWEVIEIRDGPNPLVGCTDNDGRAIPCGGTVICKGVG
jgi:hypothetical protein